MPKRKDTIRDKLHEALNDKTAQEEMRKLGQDMLDNSQQLYNLYEQDNEFNGSFEEWLKKTTKHQHALNKMNSENEDKPQNNL